MAAFALLEAEAERVVAHDRARAAGLLTQAGVALVAHGPMDRLAALAERALALAPPEAELVPAVLHASALATLGEHARARTLLRRRHEALRALDPTGPGHEILAVAALVHLWMEDYEDAERLLVWLVETCRERGAIVALAFPLAVSASLHMRRGSLGEAARLSDEAVGLGEDAVGSFLHSVTLTTAAFVAANLGDAEACTRHAEQARAIALRLDLTSTLACAEQALGFLALGAGDAATAVVHLERAREHTRRFGSRDPSFLYTHADLAEAYVRAGRPADAAALTDELAAGRGRDRRRLGGGGDRALPPARRGRRPPGRAHRGGARRARAPGAAVRARPHAAVRRRAAATRPPAGRRPPAPGRRLRDVRRAGRRAMGGARGPRAARGGRAAQRALAGPTRCSPPASGTSARSSPAAPPTARSPPRCTCHPGRSSTTCAWPTASSGSAPAPR